MIARNLLGSAFLHLTVLMAGGVWYGTVAARERLEPPELVFAPIRPQIEVADQASRLEPLEVEESSAEIELPEPIHPDNFDPPAAEMPPDSYAPRLADRLWSEALLDVLPQLAEPAPAKPIEAPPPLAYVPAEPRIDLNQPPVYPRSARSRGHEGSLRLRLNIDVEGRVIDVELLTPCRYPTLNRAAILALRTWRYRPARRAGIPAEDTIIETILFRIGA